VGPLLITETQMTDPLSFQFEEKKLANKILNSARSICKKNGVHITKVIQFGAVGPVIIRFVKNNKIDLVVMGSRGNSLAKEIFLGSVSNFVLHKSSVPVMIVK